MDDRRPNPSEQDCSTDTVVRGLRDKRRRFHELLGSQRDQLLALEHALERQFERLRSATSGGQTDPSPAVDLTEFENQRTALANEAGALATLSSELDERESRLLEFETRLKTQEQSVVEQLARQQAELDERTAEIESSTTQLRQTQRALAASEEELAADREQVARVRERLQEQLHTVEREREELAQRRSETNNQRRRVAREFQSQRHAQKAECAKEREALGVERESLRSEREHLRAEYEQQLAEVSRRREEARLLAVANDEQLQEQLESALTEAGELRRQVNEHKRTITARADELESLRAEYGRAIEEIETTRREHDRLAKEIESHNETEEHHDGEADRLRADIEALRTKLADAELRAASAPSEGDSRKRDDLKRRFELAVEDIRDLKRRNAELEEKLSAARDGQPARDTNGGKLDWESQKRKLLAALEADGDEDEEEEEARLSVEGTIRITDEIVARKDQEIAELKRVLEEQSSNLGTVAIGATAIAEILDQDQLIKQERENLLHMQDDWRQKLRQAEVDISLERARMARERIELDEKMQSLEAERAKLAAGDPARIGKGEAGSPAQRRWWARLGLKDHDKE